MDHEELVKTAQAMVATGKGIVAADESNPSANKRFEAVGLEQTEENRRLYRQLLFETPNFNDYVSGVILYDETFWQKNNTGETFADYLTSIGVMPGIKVDLGLIDLPGFPNEKLTKGLDDLPERLEKYAAAGAKFAKWRSVIVIGDGTPTDEAIGANTFVLARYARLCQEYNIVPMVEPEVLFDGTHTSEQCEYVIRRVYDILFQTMRAFRVDMEGAILKTSMVLPGKDSEHPVEVQDVSGRTAAALKENVPHDLGGVVFLSGGQTPKQAFENLNAIAQIGDYPWGLTFSYSRALQDPVLKYWANNPTDSEGAQAIFAKQLATASKASSGTLTEDDLQDNDSFVSSSQN